MSRLSGIVIPMGAEDTGLIPEGCSVQIKDGIRQDCLEGEIDLASLDFSFCPIRQNEHWIKLDEARARAEEVSAVGSLGLAAALLKAQDEGQEIFPVESRGKHLFMMP